MRLSYSAATLSFCLLTACTSTGSPPPQVGQATGSASPSAAASTAVPSTTGPSATTSAADVALLRRALLASDEVGADVTVNDITLDPSGGQASSGCTAFDRYGRTDDNPPSAAVQITGTGTGLSASEALIIRDRQTAARDFEEVKAALAGCSTLTLGAASAAIDLHLQPLAGLPSSPGQQVGRQLSGNVGGVKIGGYLLVARYGTIEQVLVVLLTGDTRELHLDLVASSAAKILRTFGNRAR